MNKKIKAIIDDGCNPELVAGAEFALPLGIPIIKATSKIIVPPGITPFSMRRRAPSFEEAVGFHEMDVNFADVLRNPEKYIDDFARFAVLISPDCSLYRDAPLSVQLTNVYRNRAIGSYYQRRGQYVIPQIRWGNEYTYTTKYFPERIAFLGTLTPVNSSKTIILDAILVDASSSSSLSQLITTSILPSSLFLTESTYTS